MVGPIVAPMAGSRTLSGETIFAISTPLGPSAQALVRISGPGSIDLLRDHFRLDGDASLDGLPGFGQVVGHLDWDGVPVPGRIMVSRRPASFTGEDLVELTVPGSVPLLAWLLRTLLVASGDEVRVAGPGEFTFRALLNGKLDLAQVEAIGRLLVAGGEGEARAAYRQLGGRLRESVAGAAREVIEALALVESAIDFPDEDIPALAPVTLARRVDAIAASLGELLGRTALRIPECGTLRVVLVGLPNAGKSSLLNAVAGAPVSLVSAQAGTTRDPVRAMTTFEGRRLEWVDLAGLEEAARGVPGLPSPGPGGEPEEEEGAAASGLQEIIRRISARELAMADLVLRVVDGVELAEDRPEALPDGAMTCRELAEVPRTLLVASKCDLLDRQSSRRLREHPLSPEVVSSKTGEGLPGLLRKIVAPPDAADAAAPRVVLEDDSVLLLSPLQEVQLLACRAALERAGEILRRDGAHELAAVDLRDALLELAPLSGSEISESLLATIFGQFCVGK